MTWPLWVSANCCLCAVCAGDGFGFQIRKMTARKLVPLAVNLTPETGCRLAGFGALVGVFFGGVDDENACPLWQSEYSGLVTVTDFMVLPHAGYLPKAQAAANAEFDGRAPGNR